MKKKHFELLEPKIELNNITFFYQLPRIFSLPKCVLLETFLSICGNLSKSEKDFISALKVIKSFENENITNLIYEHFKQKANVNINSVSFIYHFASKLNYTELAAQSLRYIERCFTMVVETNSFLGLDYESVGKILDSSELWISSEIEVFNAADRWLSHNIKERSKFAKELLMKVRLPLLSQHALRRILNKSSVFSKNPKCVALLRKVLIL